MYFNKYVSSRIAFARSVHALTFSFVLRTVPAAFCRTVWTLNRSYCSEYTLNYICLILNISYNFVKGKKKKKKKSTPKHKKQTHQTLHLRKRYKR